jgi:hypothetical protein
MTAPSIRVNGGTAGVKAAVSASAAVTATLDSTAGVRSCVWSVISTDETTSTASYTLVQSGSVGQNVAFTSLTAGTAMLLKVVINGGINLQTGLADADETTATVKVGVLTSAGYWVGVAGEEMEHDSTFGSTEIINAGIRLASTLSPSGIAVHIVKAATAAALPANTRSGNVLTANANGAFAAVDGATVNVGEYFIAQNEGGGASHVNNGVYSLTTAGDGSNPWTATRATYFNESGELIQGTRFTVQSGTTYGGRERYFVTSGATINVTALEFDAMPYAPDDAQYLVRTANTHLSNETAIDAITSTVEWESTSVVPIGAKRTDAATATLVDVAQCTALSSGASAAGFGPAVKFLGEFGGAAENYGRLGFAATDVSGGSEDTKAVIQTRTAGAALATCAEIASTGVRADGGLDALTATTLPVGGTVATRVDIGRSGQTVRTIAGTEEHYTGATAIRTDVFALAGCYDQYVAGVAEVVSACTQAAAGAGTFRRIAAGQGAAGSAGGNLELRVGYGGTGGADAPGNLDVDLGAAVANVTGKQRWVNSGGGVLGTAGQVAGPYFEIESGAVCTSGISLKSSAGNIRVDVADATIAGYDGGTLGYTINAASGGAGAFKWEGAAVTSASVEIVQPTGTGATTGRTLTVKASDGQAQSGGSANNNGGVLDLRSGAAGTGGGGAAGTPGDVTIRTGSSTRLTIAGDGTTATFTPEVIAPSLDYAGALTVGANSATQLDLAQTGVNTNIHGPAIISERAEAMYYVSEIGASPGTTGSIDLDFLTCQSINIGQLTGNLIIAVQNVFAGVTYKVVARQHASAAKTTTWAADVGFASGQDAIGTTVDTYTVWTFFCHSDGLLLCTSRQADITAPS